ncbi:MAG: hypothetical protein ABSA17_03115 [Rhabdochlamydiaceae bacterium]|jgi:hypothetical protein
MKKMIVSLVSGLLFYLMPGAQLCASPHIATLTIEGKVFINTVPPEWNRVETEEPSVYKFIHDSGKRECFLKFSCYKSTIEKEVLASEWTRFAESLFGKIFWKDSRFHPYGLFDEDPTTTTVFFVMERDTTIDTVFIRADRESSADTCCRTMIVINKIDRASFDAKTALDLPMKDGLVFCQNIAFIDAVKNK